MLELFRNIRVDWLGKRKLFFIISIVLLAAGMVSLVGKKTFRYGVDFKGGTVIKVRFKESVPVNRVREMLAEAGVPNSTIQEVVDQGVPEMQIEFGSIGEDTDAANAATAKVEKVLKDGFQDRFDIREKNTVGPKIGADLRRGAIYATLGALALMLIYIGFRFEWMYGAAAVFAVFHDTLVTLGLFSIFNREINLTVIAALLTLVGYSVNDTIVIFDRVRENKKLRRRDSLEVIMNDSINQTLSRTILTSGLTFLAVLSLFLFGGEILSHFAFAMVVGIIVGTYSSVAVAAPLVLIVNKTLEARART